MGFISLVFNCPHLPVISAPPVVYVSLQFQPLGCPFRGVVSLLDQPWKKGSSVSGL